ncbi:septum formation initiator family protein [Kitasatospora aburaviensis]
MAGWRIPGLAARPRFTSRATVLVLVLCSLVAILAYPTRQFISQRSEISAQRAKAEHARQQVEQLRREKTRWQDPEYVRAQARARLHYAMPGRPRTLRWTRPARAPPSPRGSARAVRRCGRRPGEGRQALVRERLGLRGRRRHRPALSTRHCPRWSQLPHDH